MNPQAAVKAEHRHLDSERQRLPCRGGTVTEARDPQAPPRSRNDENSWRRLTRETSDFAARRSWKGPTTSYRWKRPTNSAGTSATSGRHSPQQIEVLHDSDSARTYLLSCRVVRSRLGLQAQPKRPYPCSMKPTPGRNRSLWERIRDTFASRGHVLTPEEQDARRRAAMEQERVERQYDDIRAKGEPNSGPSAPDDSEAPTCSSAAAGALAWPVECTSQPPPVLGWNGRGQRNWRF